MPSSWDEGKHLLSYLVLLADGRYHIDTTEKAYVRIVRKQVWTSTP